MHDAERATLLVRRGVREVERAQHLVRDEERDRNREAAARTRDHAQQARERHAVDVLERHEHFAVALTEVDHLDDVRMRKARANARLVAEHRYEARVASELRQDALHCEAFGEAARARLGRDENLRHAPQPEPLPEHVGPEFLGAAVWFHTLVILADVPPDAGGIVELYGKW